MKALVCVYVFGEGLLSSTVALLPLLKLYPSAGTNAVNSVLPKEGPPLVRTKAGKIPPGKTTPHTAKLVHKCVFIKMVQLSKKKNAYRTCSSLHGNHTKLAQTAYIFLHSGRSFLYEKAVIFCSLPLFCCSYLSGNRVCRQLS